MFPYRRGKKRPKNGQAGRRGPERGPGGGRPGGIAYDLLGLMPSTTKALAQMLAGNTRASGQLQHARNTLQQAERAIEERQIDRLNPADREMFLDRLATLKLTLAAAADELEEAAAAAAEAEAQPEVKARPQVAPERLRELALSLAGELAAGAQRKAENPVQPPLAEPASLPDPEERSVHAIDEADDEQRAGSAHQKPRLRLKRRVDLASA
ncbi:MAG: hypothetical protein U1E14_18060 [Geminicoccaceae bacterium]